MNFTDALRTLGPFWTRRRFLHRSRYRT